LFTFKFVNVDKNVDIDKTFNVNIPQPISVDGDELSQELYSKRARSARFRKPVRIKVTGVVGNCNLLLIITNSLMQSDLHLPWWSPLFSTVVHAHVAYTPFGTTYRLELLPSKSTSFNYNWRNTCQDMCIFLQKLFYFFPFLFFLIFLIVSLG